MSLNRRADGSAHLIGVENEELQDWIWTQLRNGDTPSMNVFVKTQDDVPSCVNAVHLVEKIHAKIHHLLQFDGASNVVNEED